MSAKRMISCAAFIAVSCLVAGPAAAQPMELAVKKSHFIGASRGTLIFTGRGVQYRTTDKNDARNWTYDEIKQVQILSPTRIDVRTYEDQGWTKMGADRTFEFEVVKEPVTPALVTLLLRTSPRPVFTTVIPAPQGAPRFSVPAKHAKGRHGTHGELQLYADGLVYQSPEPRASRYWRFGDLTSALLLDRYRLEIVASEGGAGETESYLFQLKADLPAGFYDALWSALNAPPPLRTPADR